MELPKKNVELSNDEIIRICEYYGMDDLAYIIKSSPPDKPFKSDGVSCFPDIVGDIDLYPAAFWHDVKYWCGFSGDAESRLIADCELAIDVINLCGGKAELADLILAGVRIGGNDNFPFPWSWGFGRE